MRDAESFTPAAMTRTCQVTANPGPGPFTVKLVLPARFPDIVPVAGSNTASDGSSTVQRSGASGTRVWSAARACTWNVAVPPMGSGTSCLNEGDTLSSATDLCTTTSMTLDCSRPETSSVVRPGATAVTTPVSETRAMLGSAVAHCIATGLTTRLPCAGTITWSVSTSPGESATGVASKIAISLCWTTTGAVAVRPVALMTWTVPWPGASATTRPF